MNLAHGKAYERIKGLCPEAKVGITHATQQYRNLSGDAVSEELIAKLWDENNGVYLEPILSGRYPESVLASRGSDFPTMLDEDLRCMNQYDFIGLQYYFDYWDVGDIC